MPTNRLWTRFSTPEKIQNKRKNSFQSAVPAYGYLKSDDEKHTPIIEPETAPIVRRIFELRAKGKALEQGNCKKAPE